MFISQMFPKWPDEMVSQVDIFERKKYFLSQIESTSFFQTMFSNGNSKLYNEIWNVCETSIVKQCFLFDQGFKIVFLQNTLSFKCSIQ